MSILPKQCPACSSKLHWTVNDKGKKVDLFCPNENCLGPKKRQIAHFFKVLTADGITETTVENMLAAGFKDIPEILLATPKQLAKIEGFADKKIKNTLLSLTKLINNINLAKLAHASGLFTNQSTGIGATLLSPIIDKLGRKVVLEGKIDSLKLKLQLLKIPNIGNERAELFVEKLAEFRQFYKSLTNISLAPEQKRGKLTGQIFCFTNFRDIELQLKLEQNGAQVRETMSRQITTLFAAAPSSKTALAEKYGIPIVLKSQLSSFLAKVGIE